MIQGIRRGSRWWVPAVAVMAGLLAWILRGSQPWWRSLAYRELILHVAPLQGVDPALVYALIWQESRFRPGCVGTRGEFGLMQVTPGAAREWAHAAGVPAWSTNDLFDPRTNLLAGTWYLGRAIRRWNTHEAPVACALAEYNAGLSNARRWAAAPGGETATGFVAAISYPTTRRYVVEIQRRARRGF